MEMSQRHENPNVVGARIEQIEDISSIEEGKTAYSTFHESAKIESTSVTLPTSNTNTSPSQDRKVFESDEFIDNQQTFQHQQQIQQDITNLTLGFSTPWSLEIYKSQRGAEIIHFLTWLLKDFFWVMDYKVCGMIFGSLSLIWCGVLMYHAFIQHAYDDLYMVIGTTIWLFGNFWWMRGEIVFDDDGISATTGAHAFEATLIWILLYHILWKPLGVFKNQMREDLVFKNVGLKPRFSYFETWKQYEYAHVFFWCGKDWCWNISLGPLWVIFFFFTFMIGFDFIYLTYHTKCMTIDFVHHISQLLWVSANCVWAGAEVFGGNRYNRIYDTPMYIFDFSSATINSARWYSSWIIFIAFIPVTLLYIVWFILTWQGKIKKNKEIDIYSIEEVYDPAPQ